jgi:osmotically-inducible protein OsmY
VVKRIVITMLCVASLSGCASFISGGTGTAPVGTDQGARTLGQVFIDSSIVRTAKINLYKLDSRFKQSRVNIESFHGHVLLTGQVPDAHLKQLAEDNVKAMSDVKAVHNFITIGNQISYGTIMQDTAATANTRGLIMKAPVVADSKVHVHTEDGVLYVMGRLNNAEMAQIRNDIEYNYHNMTPEKTQELQVQLNSMANIFKVLNLNEASNDLTRQAASLSQPEVLKDEGFAQQLMNVILSAMNSIGVLERHHTSSRLQLRVNNMNISLDRLDEAHAALLSETKALIELASHTLMNYLQDQNLQTLESLPNQIREIAGAMLFLNAENGQAALSTTADFIQSRIESATALSTELYVTRQRGYAH